MYSQKDEEAYILRAVEGMETGTFLDIGAYDGLNYSNTMALVDRGWKGIMVEPGLEAFDRLLYHHGGNDKLTLIHAAVGDGKWTQFWNNTTTFSTTLASNRDRFHFEGFAPPYLIPTVTVDDLLLHLSSPHIDVLSIDTEGTSVDVFRSCGSWRPKVACVEHDGRVDECKQIAESRHYSLMMQNEENIIFVR